MSGDSPTEQAPGHELPKTRALRTTWRENQTIADRETDDRIAIRDFWMGNVEPLARSPIHFVAGEQGTRLESIGKLVDRPALIVEVQCEVALGGFERGMAQLYLDLANVRTRAQQINRE